LSFRGFDNQHSTGIRGDESRWSEILSCLDRFSWLQAVNEDCTALILVNSSLLGCLRGRCGDDEKCEHYVERSYRANDGGEFEKSHKSLKKETPDGRGGDDVAIRELLAHSAWSE
jgi:hypothetical protein